MAYDCNDCLHKTKEKQQHPCVTCRRQYGDHWEPLVKIGDEVRMIYSDTTCVVTAIYRDERDNKKCTMLTERGYFTTEDVGKIEPTGVYYPEITMLLMKMRGGE
jgi:hypothetical protein